MNKKMRRNLPGTFQPSELGMGIWRLARAEPAAADIFLRGAESGASEILSSQGVADVEIEWRPEGVVLTLTRAARRCSLRARSAIVHEPLASLYDALPLVTFDDQARRFWRRVFRLVRIPGGRHLLGILARRTRK